MQLTGKVTVVRPVTKGVIVVGELVAGDAEDTSPSIEREGSKTWTSTSAFSATMLNKPLAK